MDSKRACLPTYSAVFAGSFYIIWQNINLLCNKEYGGLELALLLFQMKTMLFAVNYIYGHIHLHEPG